MMNDVEPETPSRGRAAGGGGSISDGGRGGRGVGGRGGSGGGGKRMR